MASNARGLFPMPAAATLADLLARTRKALVAHDFAAARVLPFPGTRKDLVFDLGNVRRYHRGEHNVHGMSSLSTIFYQRFKSVKPDAFALFQVFCLGRGVAESRLATLLSKGLFDEMVAARILVPTEGGVTSRLAATPIGSNIHFHDWDQITEAEKTEFTYLGPDSVFLATKLIEHVRSRRLRRVLDLCTGGGVQGIEAADACDEVIGVDINARAVAIAEANAHASEKRNARFLVGDMYAGLDGRFDLVTANAPFLLLPQDSRRVSSQGGALGIEIALRLFEGLDEYLHDGGEAIVISSSPQVRGSDVLVARLEAMFGAQRSGWAVDLDPIGQWYPTTHREEYERQGVAYCTLYLVRIEKGAGARAGIRVKRQQPWVAGAYWLLGMKHRLLGSRRGRPGR